MKKYTKSFVTGPGEPIAIDIEKSNVRVMDHYVYDLEGSQAPKRDEAEARDPGKVLEEKRNTLKALLQDRKKE